MTSRIRPDNFHSLYAQGFVRVAVGTYPVSPGDPMANAAETIKAARRADTIKAAMVLFPELGLSGYAIDDLLLQDVVLDRSLDALEAVCSATIALLPLVLVGLPLRWRGRLFNCAAVLHKGRVLGVVPKTYLPNYREFYEARHFTSARGLPHGETIELFGERVPFGVDLLFSAQDLENFVVAVEICEDVWVPIQPSAFAVLAGATIIANLSASNAIVGKSEYRHSLCSVQSSRCFCGYLYSAAGYGESTTDLAWDGQSMIYENGALLAEAPRFSRKPELIVADIDVERLANERARHGTFADCASANRAYAQFREVTFRLDPPAENLDLLRPHVRFPFVPSDAGRLDALCEETFEIQSQGLARRMEAAGLKKVVVGVSGGLDSSHALLVGVHALDRLGLPRANVLAYTLPAFATSSKTRSTALALMRSLDVTAEEVDLTPSALQMLRDIKHPAVDGVPQYDVAYENVQAGARTSLLFRLANFHDALVLGTGDLSELALGWCTYGVGDHMSHYNVNASVPKTLIQHLIRWVVAKGVYGQKVSETLEVILSTDISPELIPGDGIMPSQKTEEVVGPYALQDFNLFYITRYGMRPSKVAFLAWHAWRDASEGSWPPHLDDSKKLAYDLDTIRCWVRIFLWRFFQTSQYKRSVLPNGPKISSGGSLSPRGDWRAPSDGNARAWIAELDGALPRPGESDTVAFNTRFTRLTCQC
jgi:NAD+ synthase (glutamine-hydrolysing)